MFGDETLMSFAARIVLKANEREVVEAVVARVAVDVVKLQAFARAAHAATLTIASGHPPTQPGHRPWPGPPPLVTPG
jgi:hypothetical protein